MSGTLQTRTHTDLRWRSTRSTKRVHPQNAMAQLFEPARPGKGHQGIHSIKAKTYTCLCGCHPGSESPHLSSHLNSVGHLCGKLVPKLGHSFLQILHCLGCLRTVPGSSCFLA